MEETDRCFIILLINFRKEMIGQGLPGLDVTMLIYCAFVIYIVKNVRTFTMRLKLLRWDISIMGI